MLRLERTSQAGGNQYIAVTFAGDFMALDGQDRLLDLRKKAKVIAAVCAAAVDVSELLSSFEARPSPS